MTADDFSGEGSEVLADAEVRTSALVRENSFLRKYLKTDDISARIVYNDSNINLPNKVKRRSV